MADSPLHYETAACQEIWKLVPSMPLIEASNFGRIRIDARLVASKRELQPTQLRRGQILRGERTQSNYRAIAIKVDGERKRIFVHRLVCEAFHGPIPDGDYTVDHLDGDRINNAPENLEWVTRAENSRRQNAAGRGAPKGEAHPIAKLTDYQSECVLRLRNDGWRIAEYRDCSVCRTLSSMASYRAKSGIMPNRPQPMHPEIARHSPQSAARGRFHL